MRRGTPQRLRARLPSELHAGRMNHESRLQFSARGDGRIADRDTADGIALALDLFSAFAANGSSNARARSCAQAVLPERIAATRNWAGTFRQGFDGDTRES